MDALNTLIERAAGKKFYFAVILFLGYLVLTLTKQIDGNQFVEGMKWVAITFFGAQFGSDSASNIVETIRGGEADGS